MATVDRTVALGGVSSLHAGWYTATGSASFDEAPAITGTVAESSTLTVSDIVTYQATVAISGAGSFAAGITIERAASFQPFAEVLVQATVTSQIERTAAPTSASTLTVGRTITRQGSVAVSAASGLTVARTITRNSSVGIVSDSFLTVARAITRDRQAVISSQSEMAAVGSVAGSTNVLISATSALHVGWYKNTSALQFKSAPIITGTVADGQTLTVSDPVNYEGGAAVDGASAMDAVADDPLSQATVSISAVSGMSAVGTVGSVLTLGGGTLNTAPDPDEIFYTLDGAGTVYWAVFKTSDTPDGAAIEAGGDYFGGSIVFSGPATVGSTFSITNVVTGSYKISAVAKSPAGYSNIVETNVTITNEFLAQFLGASDLQIVGIPLTQRIVQINGQGNFRAGITIDRSVSTSGTSGVAAVPVVLEQSLVPSSVSFTAASTLKAGITIERAFGISGTSGVQADGVPTSDIFRLVEIASASVLTASSSPIRHRAADIVSTSLFSVERGRILQRSALFSAASTSIFSSTGFIFQRQADIASASSLSASTILGILPDLLYARPGDKPFGGRVVTNEYNGIVRGGEPRHGRVIDSKRSGRIIR